MSRVPRIRFKGFEEDWEQCKLGEMCQITMGQSPDGSTYSETPSDFILVQGNADLKDGWIFPRIWTTQKTKTADAGDLIMSVRAPAGAMGKTAYNVVLGRGVAGIKGNEFIYQSLVKMDSDGYWKKLAAGSTFESINSDVVNGAELIIPQDIEEQIQIGSFFANLDNLITLHQSKSFWYILKSIVSCTLYWEQRKLGELMNVISVKRIHQSDWSTEGVRFLRARDIVADYKHEEVEDLLYISQEKYEECSALVGKVAIDDMLVTGVGTIGIPYLIKDLTPLYFKDGNIIWFQNNGKIQGDFFYYSFTAAQIQNFIKDSAGIGTVGTYTIESGKKTPILLPSEAEQNKIGQFFKDLDNLITLHQLEPYNLIFKAIAYRIIDYAKSKPPKCIK